ncbi:hypothetical protein SCLCIDRAFT_1223972 [Scleroderma citrinum Foug A]|uniref:Uncharacterized protein n=1 Tax=Scleroderma citrinum Foug A TaxID=1036808 RepID=A0A0C2ZH89_9AGAM|nr:hypothetical protein SCLCIDRAFT_1223972 [Scleroderma citrinum Foug A]
MPTTSQSSSPPSVKPPSVSFIPMPLYGDERRFWIQRRKSGEPIAYHHIRFLPWGRTTKFFGGVPLNDCLAMRENSITDAHDPVFSFQAAKHITFMLRWPGYDNLQWVAHIPVWTDCVPITRAELASWIAYEFWKFFEECKAGSYSCSEPEWKVGQGRVTFDRINLASIWSPEDGLWLASVQIIQP